MEETINHVKENLMPDYDYDEFTRRHEEYEEGDKDRFEPNKNGQPDLEKGSEIDDDISW